MELTFSFFWNHNHRETEDFLSLLPLLYRCSSMRPYKRLWSLERTSEFSCKSFLSHIGNPPSSGAFPLNKFIWKANIPPKVKAFAWTVVLRRVNTNYLSP